MKAHLQNLIAQALQPLQQEGLLPNATLPAIPLERTRDRTHGDFASTIALALAQTEGEEKNHRLHLMRERHLTELEAALVVADEIGARRRRYALLESREAP